MNADHFGPTGHVGNRALQWMRKNPSFSLPLITLYAYMITLSYLDGYLAYFSAASHWFSPSVFQLIAFARWPLLTAALVVVLYHVLIVHASTPSRLWVPCCIVWSIFIICIAALQALAWFVYKGDITAWSIAYQASLMFPWVGGPILIRRWSRWLNTRDSEFWIKHESRLSSYGWLIGFAPVMVIIGLGGMFLSTAGTMGRISAFVDLSTTSNSPPSQDKSIIVASILFTDGTASILREHTDDGIRTVFTDGRGMKVELGTAWDRSVAVHRTNLRRLETCMPEWARMGAILTRLAKCASAPETSTKSNTEWYRLMSQLEQSRTRLEELSRGAMGGKTDARFQAKLKSIKSELDELETESLTLAKSVKSDEP